MQNVFKSRTVQNLLRFDRPEKFTKAFDSHVMLPVLEPPIRVHNCGFMGS